MNNPGSTEVARNARRFDITGMRSGMAVALEKTTTKRKGVSLWRCRCDCGKEFLTEAGNIRSERVQSCGCLRNIKRIKILPDSDSENSQHFIDSTKNRGQALCGFVAATAGIQSKRRSAI